MCNLPGAINIMCNLPGAINMPNYDPPVLPIFEECSKNSPVMEILRENYYTNINFKTLLTDIKLKNAYIMKNQNEHIILFKGA